MGVDQSAVSSLSNMDDLYNYMDEHALMLGRKRELKNLIVAFRDKTIDDSEKELAQWELESFLFDLKGKGVFSYSYSAGKSADDYQKYPSLEAFQEKSRAYILTRSDTANNPFLLARYNHLLWRSAPGIKRKQFAINAIDAYFKCINFYIKQYEQDTDSENHFKISDLFDTLVILVAETKERIVELKILVQSLLYKTAHIPFYIKHSMLESMLNIKYVFKPVDFKDSLSIFEIEFRDIKKEWFLWVHNYLPTCFKIARRISGDLKIWYERLGDLNAAQADIETDPGRFWIKHNMYASAVVAYKNSGNIGKRKRIEQAIFELKPLITLPSITVNRTEKQIKDLKLRNKIIYASCEALLKEDPEVVYENLIQGWYYPPISHFEDMAKEKKYVYEDFLTLVEYDRNKNIRKRSETHTNRKFNEFYHHAVESVTLQYFYYVFIPGIRSGHLTYENFLGYLRRYTWLGMPYQKTDIGGHELTVDWIMLITPSIIEFFVQVQSWQWGNNYFPNFILCIDSLTLKMEGIFRNFSERMNISTTVAGKAGTQEAYIHNVLDNPAVVKHFDEDDLKYFKYIFANEGGINLRNNIAHSYYNFYDYNLDKMLLLLAALIKVAKFQAS